MTNNSTKTQNKPNQTPGWSNALEKGKHILLHVLLNPFCLYTHKLVDKSNSVGHVRVYNVDIGLHASGRY